jgi:hypothetical protein
MASATAATTAEGEVRKGVYATRHKIPQVSDEATQRKEKRLFANHELI